MYAPILYTYQQFALDQRVEENKKLTQELATVRDDLVSVKNALQEAVDELNASVYGPENDDVMTAEERNAEDFKRMQRRQCWDVATFLILYGSAVVASLGLGFKMAEHYYHLL